MVCMRDKANGVWSHVWRCLSTSRARGDTLMTPDHTAVQVRRAESELVGVPGQAFAHDVKRKLRSVVHAVG